MIDKTHFELCKEMIQLYSMWIQHEISSEVYHLRMSRYALDMDRIERFKPIEDEIEETHRDLCDMCGENEATTYGGSDGWLCNNCYRELIEGDE